VSLHSAPRARLSSLMAFSALGCAEGCCLPREAQLRAGSRGLHISLPLRHEELRHMGMWEGVQQEGHWARAPLVFVTAQGLRGTPAAQSGESRAVCRPGHEIFPRHMRSC